MPNSESFLNYYLTWLFWRIRHHWLSFLETHFLWFSFSGETASLPSSPVLFYMALFLNFFLPCPDFSLKRKKSPHNFQGPIKISPPLYTSPPPPRLRLSPVICSFVSVALFVYCFIALHYSLTSLTYLPLSTKLQKSSRAAAEFYSLLHPYN